MSNRRAQDERIEGTPDGSNAISEIVDVPDAPTIGTATAGMVSASITFTPATTGGTATLYTATSTPGSITGTSATSPITISNLNSGTSYTFKVKGSNSTGTGAESSASNSITPTPAMEGAYDALAVVTLSATASSVIFNSIPSGYKHLQLRTNYAMSSGGILKFNLNADTGSNYKSHNFAGDGSTAYAGVASTSPNAGCFGYANSTTFGVVIADFLDYSNTSKNKVIRSLGGNDRNGSGDIELDSTLWINTSAISSIAIAAQNGNLSANSSFVLYGVK